MHAHVPAIKTARSNRFGGVPLFSAEAQTQNRAGGAANVFMVSLAAHWLLAMVKSSLGWGGRNITIAHQIIQGTSGTLLLPHSGGPPHSRLQRAVQGRGGSRTSLMYLVTICLFPAYIKKLRNIISGTRTHDKHYFVRSDCLTRFKLFHVVGRCCECISFLNTAGCA